MNIKGLFDYDKMKLAKDNLESELLMAKDTATELTKQNDYLHAKILELDSEITDLKRELEKAKKENKLKWRYTHFYTKNGVLGVWVPTNGTPLQIITKYPAVFPEYMVEKKVPEV